MTPLPAATRLGSVALVVADLARSLHFYNQLLGFEVLAQSQASATLTADGTTPLIELAEIPGAQSRPARSTGLYHFAILLPDRLNLAYALRTLVYADWPLQGASDHGVSEAIYLADPDGNGIELYRDRPREEWPWRNGQLEMATEALDLRGVLAELDQNPGPWPGMPAAATIGHVHLHVARLHQAEAFYVDLLGFDVMQRYRGTALFLSAGGYHHHIGLNIWAGVGAPRPPAGSAGLHYFTIQLPQAAELAVLVSRLAAAGISLERQADGWRLEDPSGNGIRLASAGADAGAGDSRGNAGVLAVAPPQLSG